MTAMAIRDPDVRKLAIEYARAVAVAERLAFELDKTVVDLGDFIRAKGEGMDNNKTTASLKESRGKRSGS